MTNTALGVAIAVLAGSAVQACASSSGSGGGNSSDSGATPDAGALVCPGPLPDAGFSTLDQVPVTSLCAQSYASQMGRPGGTLTRQACGSWTLLWQGVGADCHAWWLFDTESGALEATGGGCSSNDCTGAAAGFSIPDVCLGPDAEIMGTQLCPDGGADRDATAD